MPKAVDSITGPTMVIFEPDDLGTVLELALVNVRIADLQVRSNPLSNQVLNRQQEAYSLCALLLSSVMSQHEETAKIPGLRERTERVIKRAEHLTMIRKITEKARNGEPISEEDAQTLADLATDAIKNMKDRGII